MPGRKGAASQQQHETITSDSANSAAPAYIGDGDAQYIVSKNRAAGVPRGPMLHHNASGKEACDGQEPETP
jgi:hypothetical protein